jgi:hypothetical protein
MGIGFYNRTMTRAISVLLGLGLLATTGVAADSPSTFQEHAAVQESLSRVHPRMRASWLRERGIEDPYYTAVRRPDSGQGLVEVGRWSYGPSYDVDGRVTASETLVALARGSGVSLLRFSRQDSLSIELLSDINAEGLMCRVKVVDTLLYVGSRGGLEVYDISDERAPVRLSWTPIPLNDFALQDSLAYTISGDNLFRIYNVSNPASPVFRGSCADSGDLVSVAGNAAFLGGRWGLYVIDITNLASPHRIGSWGGDIEQVEARGRLCYVTTAGVEPGDIAFHILDVAVPSLPYQIGSLDSAGGNDLFLVDTLVYGAGEYYFNKLTVISVADSTRPRLVGSAATRGWSYGIWASGLAQESFLGCHWEGLQIYDARNTSSPVRDTFLLGCDQSVDICIDNDRAYVANEKSGLKILDISDPTRPKTIGSCDTTGQRPHMTSVVARDSFAFVDWYAVPVFRSMDVSVPSLPVMVGGVDVFNPPEDMVLRDSFVYCAETYRFQVVNVGRPRQPELAGSCNLPGFSGKMDMQDSLAYVTNTVFSIVNVARPASPTVVGNYGARIQGIDVADSILFGAAPYTGLLALSVVDPTHVYALDSLPLTDTIWWSDVVVEGSRAYVGGERVWGVDVSDPEDLQLIPGVSWTPPYLIERMEYYAPYVYSACLEAGVCILESTAVGVTDASRDQPTAEQFLRVEPNLMRGSVHVAGIDPACRVRVFDAAGRDVTERVSFVRNSDALCMDGERLSGGIYFVKSEDGNIRNVAKLIKP